MGKVERHVNKHGQAARPLIYQVESRTRSEHANRVRRRGMREYAVAIRSGQLRDFDPKRPWGGGVWGQLTEGIA